MAKVKAYSYTRFSTDEQKKGDSIRRQVQLAIDYAAKNELDLDDSLHLRAEGVSGFRGKNVTADSALGMFLASVQSGEVAAGSFLLVENLDRLSRQMARKAVRVLENLCDAGITVVTLNDEHKYTRDVFEQNPWAFIEAVIGFTRAHEESAVKSKRLKESWKGKRIKAKLGEPISAICPAWMELDRSAKKFRLIAPRVKIVRRIYREALKGVGQHLIAEHLNQEGIEVFGRGRYWHRSYIAKVLSNPAVTGLLTPHTIEYDADYKKSRTPVGKKETVKSYYPTVIAGEVFKRVQVLTKESAAPLRGRHAKAGNVFNLLGGLGRCGRCNGALTIVNKGKAPKGARYLVCSAAKTGAGCKYQALRYERVESALLNGASFLFAHMPTGAGGEGVDREIAQAEGNIEACDDAIENLLRATERGGKSASVTARIREIEDERESLKQSVTLLSAQSSGMTRKAVKLRANELRDALKAEPIDRTLANALMRQVFEAVTVDYESGRLQLRWRHGGTSDIAYEIPTFAKATKKKRKR